MKQRPILPRLIERFFTERLVRQRNLSPHTIASLSRYVSAAAQSCTEKHLKLQPSSLELWHIDAPLIVAFLDDLRDAPGCRCTHS